MRQTPAPIHWPRPSQGLKISSPAPDCGEDTSGIDRVASGNAIAIATATAALCVTLTRRNIRALVESGPVPKSLTALRPWHL
jgi:hypothetical protein